MTHKEELAAIEWEFVTGAIGYDEYRVAVKNLWAKKSPPPRKQPECVLQFNPEPGIAVRSTLARGGMSR